MNKSFKIIVILLCLAGGSSLYAQQQLADSLKKLLATELPDTTRAYNMMMLAMYTEPVDLDKAHLLYREAVDFSLEHRLDYFAGLALYYEATPYYLSSDYVNQRSNLDRAIRLFQQSDHPKARSQLAAAYGGLSGCFRGLHRYDSAVDASLQAIRILEETGNNRSLAIQSLNLAMIYQQLNLPDKQKEYVDKGTAAARKSGDKSLIMLAFLQQAQYFTEMRRFAEAKACADSATPYYSGSFDFSRRQNYHLIKAGTFQNVKAYDSALVYFVKCYDLAKMQQSRWNMTEPLMQIGYIHLQQKEYGEAEKYVKMGLEIAEADSFLVFMKEGYGTLSDVYAATGRYKESHKYLVRYNELKESLQSEERKKFALELEKKYEIEKQEVKIQQLEAEKRIQELSLREKILIIQTLAGILLTLVIVGFLLMRNYRQKQKLQMEKIQKLEAEKLLAATEAVLKGEEQERSRLAKDLHDGLGGLLSGIKYSFQNMKGNLILTPDNAQAFDRSLDMLDSSIQEMRRVAHNLMPETLLVFGLDTALKDFCVAINQSGVIRVNYQSFGLESSTLEQTVSITLYRVIQELVSNTIKHAQARQLLIQITKSDKLLLIDVEDDGQGFNTDLLEKSIGMGWKNVKSRIDYLNGQIDIHSQTGAGTSTHIEILLK